MRLIAFALVVAPLVAQAVWAVLDALVQGDAILRIETE